MVKVAQLRKGQSQEIDISFSDCENYILSNTPPILRRKNVGGWCPASVGHMTATVLSSEDIYSHQAGSIPRKEQDALSRPLLKAKHLIVMSERQVRSGILTINSRLLFSG